MSKYDQQVDPDDDGIRPAGPDDACFYCRSRVGELHDKDCVAWLRRVKVRYTFEIETDMPTGWDEEEIAFHWHGSSWCSTNALDEIREYIEEEHNGCACQCFQGEILDD